MSTAIEQRYARTVTEDGRYLHLRDDPKKGFAIWDETNNRYLARRIDQAHAAAFVKAASYPFRAGERLVKELEDGARRRNDDETRIIVAAETIQR